MNNSEIDIILPDYSQIYTLSPISFDTNYYGGYSTGGPNGYFALHKFSPALYKANGRYALSASTFDSVGDHYGVRPVVSLKKGTVFSSGTGSASSPWIVQ